MWVRSWKQLVTEKVEAKQKDERNLDIPKFAGKVNTGIINTPLCLPMNFLPTSQYDYLVLTFDFILTSVSPVDHNFLRRKVPWSSENTQTKNLTLGLLFTIIFSMFLNQDSNFLINFKCDNRGIKGLWGLNEKHTRNISNIQNSVQTVSGKLYLSEWLSYYSKYLCIYIFQDFNQVSFIK